MKEEKQEAAMIDEAVNDPAEYERCAAPFESIDEAQEKIDELFKGVRELRGRLRIANVYLIVADEIKDKGKFMVRASNGAADQCEAMTAWAFGIEQRARQERIAGLVGGSLKNKMGK